MSTEEQRQEWARLAEAATTAPWIIEAGDYSGSNWLVASLGASCIDDKCYTVTTDHIHASELEGDAKTDAEFIAASRAAVPELLADVDRLTGDNAALSEALDTALLHLKESEAERDALAAKLYYEQGMGAGLKDEGDTLRAAVKRLVAERDALAGQLAEAQAVAAREKARREHDSVDAYNARINEAVRHLREQEERGIR
jgi:hypothetical protein